MKTTWKSIVLISILLIAGCAKTPKIYTMDPILLEKARSEIETVGVSLSSNYPKTQILLPAKGVWGGMKRGFVVGASMPIMIGFVSPFPGGTALGIFLSPLGAIVGSVHGMTTALPAEEVEHAEVILEMTTDYIREMGLRESFLHKIVKFGNERTGLNFVPLQEGEAVTAEHDGGQPSYPSKPTIDAKLVVEMQKVGMRGRYSINPPMEVFFQLHVQLIRIRDDAILLEEQFTCTSDDEITFNEWSAQRGSRMIEELRSCSPEMAEKMIDDFFRVHPIKWHGE